jgi:hypothetical protein
MVPYFGRLCNQIAVTDICLLLDQFEAHDMPSVHNEAHQQNIDFVFIPRGRMGKYQSLDRRTFGALNAKAH